MDTHTRIQEPANNSEIENSRNKSHAKISELTVIFKYVYWYMKQISGERLQDHWSSGLAFLQAFKIIQYFFFFFSAVAVVIIQSIAATAKLMCKSYDKFGYVQLQVRYSKWAQMSHVSVFQGSSYLHLRLANYGTRW